MEAAALQRTSVWLVIRVLGLTLIAAVVLFKLAAPRTTVSPGEEVVPQQQIGRDVEPARKAQDAGFLVDGADRHKAGGDPAAAGMGAPARADGPARAN